MLKTIADFCSNKHVLYLAEKKSLLYSMFFTFIPDDATLIEILNNSPHNLEIVSKKYPNILFEHGDTSNFFYALLDGEIVADFSPIDWNDPFAMRDHNLKIGEYEALKKNYGKVVTINA